MLLLCMFVYTFVSGSNSVTARSYAIAVCPHLYTFSIRKNGISVVVSVVKSWERRSDTTPAKYESESHKKGSVP